MSPEAETAAPRRTRRKAAARKLQKRTDAAFVAFVRGASDVRIERTIGSAAGLRVVFGVMAKRFRPRHALGLHGDILFDLKTARGRARPWTMTVGGERARARPGPSEAPRLTISMSVADMIRLGAGELDAAKALLAGRLRLDGDFDVAGGLLAMFGGAARA